ncbi:F-box only protein 34 [Seriola aureovittata]|uniref:F-box only protein 34 n=1 Tax=Seriola aureovittata TaxID=2871759 RepID=UPI0024BE231D|nr:F-box only protein 34 [Seriola aureovittata]
MHLKSYPKLMRSELRLDAAGVQTSSQRSSLFVSQQGALLKTCSSNHGNISSSRLPFSVISTNTLRCSNGTNSNIGSNVASLRLRASSSITLQLLPPPPGCENDTLRLYQTATEDVDAPLDIWTVIKPGHVREKIAIFASEEGRTDGARGSEHTSTSSSGGRDRAPLVCTNHSTMSGLTRAVKAKGSWEENCSAKRRRRSGSNQNQNLQQDQRTQVLDAQQHNHNSSPRRSDSTQTPGSRRCGDEAVTAAEEEEQKVSVVEMVAFLEQRASEQQLDCKPVLALQRSSTTITLSRPLPSEVKEGSEVREGSEDRGEEPESVKVSDMVAKLESECLRRKTEGDLSRSNSLRRMVGRVLLTAGDQGSSVTSSMTSSSSSLLGAQSPSREPISCSETASALTTPPSSLSGEAQEVGVGGALERQSTVTESQTVILPPQPEEAEPVPGLLFLSLPPAASACTDSIPPPKDSEPRPPHHRTTFDQEPAPSQPRPLAVSPSPDSGSQSEKRRWRKSGGGQEGEVVGASPCSAAVPLGRRASVSQDFLEMRQRLQQLLEPQPYLAVLPHHLLVKIFLLLPTQSLAALKCTCHYFKFVIENYGVRPADSLWVSDPRYRDDPCKQCKKRYGRGDVSLCRWHHKPYCQALPYGPGYWMCCHGAHRDAPGCNVGLHDNRWVPAFHSINVPIYRRSHDDD